MLLDHSTFNTLIDSFLSLSFLYLIRMYVLYKQLASLSKSNICKAKSTHQVENLLEHFLRKDWYINSMCEI